MRQRGLFSGATLSEDQLEALLSPIYPQLWGMIHESFVVFADFRQRFAEFRLLTEGQAAGFIRAQIEHAATILFAKHPDVKLRTIQNQFFLQYKDAVLITPKKFRVDFRGRLTFSSYRTKRNDRYWGQDPVEGIPYLPRLIVGYKFMQEMTSIQIMVAYPRGKQFRLCYLMPDQNGKAVTMHHEEVADVAPSKGFKVKTRKIATEKMG